MTIFQSHPQPEKVALKSVESPESSLRFRQILQLRLDLAIVGRRSLGDIGHEVFREESPTNKQTKH